MSFSAKPLLIYFPPAGRAELCRLICAAGNLEIDEDFPGLDFKKKVGFFGQMPILRHGRFAICESSAIERYLASIAPKFRDLTPQQRAVDDMYAATKEDLIPGCVKVVFGDQRKAPEVIPELMDRFLIPLERMIPESGFVNGLDFPTVADLALLNIAEARMLFQKAIELAGNYDWKSKFPKMKALVERTKQVPGVKEYMSATTSMKMDLSLGVKANMVFHTLSRNVLQWLPQLQQQQQQNCLPLSAPISTGPNPLDVPEMLYFSVAGRGELCRLICAAGGVEYKETDPGTDYATKVGFFGSLPVLKHGSLAICQSGAIEKYLATIAPKFRDLTPQQRAIDDMYAAAKEDLLQGCAKVVFGDTSRAPESIPKLMDKFLTVLETMIPESGFINGLEFPTVADLAVLNITEAKIPFKKAIELAGGYDWRSAFPKMEALADRTKQAPGVKEYLLTTTSMHASFS